MRFVQVAQWEGDIRRTWGWVLLGQFHVLFGFFFLHLNVLLELMCYKYELPGPIIAKGNSPEWKESYVDKCRLNIWIAFVKQCHCHQLNPNLEYSEQRKYLCKTAQLWYIMAGSTAVRQPRSQPPLSIGKKLQKCISAKSQESHIIKHVEERMGWEKQMLKRKDSERSWRDIKGWAEKKRI